MNPISLDHDETRLRWRAMRPGLNCAALIFVFTFFSALPSNAYSWYSGVSVGSNGTVYGWGGTGGTTFTMYHIAYVWTTLTSPVKHRQAGPAYHSAQNSVRADVWLPFDPGDLGTYLVQSTNQAYDYGCLCYFINTQSQAQVNDAPARLVHYDNPPCAPNGVGPLQVVTNGSVVDCGGKQHVTGFDGANRNLAYQLVDATGAVFPAAYTLWPYSTTAYSASTIGGRSVRTSGENGSEFPKPAAG
jgi:hypothetical protein